MRKRLPYIIASTVLLAACFFGCSGEKLHIHNNPDNPPMNMQQKSENKTSFQKKSNGLPITDKIITLKYFVPLNSSIIKSLENNIVYQELEKLTNVKIDFIHPQGEQRQSFQLLLASKNLPDIIEHVAAYYPGGPDKAIEDGVYLRLNELIDQFAPNYKKLRESNEEIARQTISDAGNIWSFDCIQNVIEPPWTGLCIRKDWLDEIGLQIPTTIDEMYVVLKAFKEQLNVEAPLTWWVNWMNEFGFLIGAWDIGYDFYQINGNVKFGPIEPEYIKYLSTMSKWYQEGLIDPEFPTRKEDSILILISEGKTGVYVYRKTIEPKIQEFTAPVPYLTLKGGAVRHINQKNFYNKNERMAVITSSCKYPVEAVKWFDYHYSDDGMMMFNYGIEGITYNIVNGKPQYTDLVLKNPDGYAPEELRWVYKVHLAPYLRIPGQLPGVTELYKYRQTVWNDSCDGKYMMPPITLNAQEGTEFDMIMNEINTYLDDMHIKFIMGLEPLEKYDLFVQQLKRMGIERAIEIKQSALNRYMNRKN